MCFSSALFVWRKWRSITFPVRLETVNQVFLLLLFNLQVCGLKEWWYLGIFLWSVTLQNGVSATSPHLQGAAARRFCGINRYRQPHFHWSLTNLESSVWLRRCCSSHERMWYQEGLNFFTCKENGGSAGSKAEMVRVGTRFEGCEFNDKLLIHPELSAVLENANALQLHHYHMIIVRKFKAIWAG